MVFVPPSVMPKGVEHTGIVLTFVSGILVPPSVMPKGVEHLASRIDWIGYLSAPLSDAERR